MKLEQRIAVMRDEELLALVLGGSRAAALAGQAVMTWARSRLRIMRMGGGDLRAIPAVGPVRARRLLGVFELVRRLSAADGEEVSQIRCAADVDRRLRGRLALLEQEVFVALALDARSRVIDEIDVASGGRAGVSFRAADAFRVLVREGAFAAVFAHNHPSGDPAPSEPDLELTAELVRAGRLLGIDVRDHVIIARRGYHGILGAHTELRSLGENSRESTGPNVRFLGHRVAED